MIIVHKQIKLVSKWMQQCICNCLIQNADLYDIISESVFSVQLFLSLPEFITTLQYQSFQVVFSSEFVFCQNSLDLLATFSSQDYKNPSKWSVYGLNNPMKHKHHLLFFQISLSAVHKSYYFRYQRTLGMQICIFIQVNHKWWVINILDKHEICIYSWLFQTPSPYF